MSCLYALLEKQLGYFSFVTKYSDAIIPHTHTHNFTENYFFHDNTFNTFLENLFDTSVHNLFTVHCFNLVRTTA